MASPRSRDSSGGEGGWARVPRHEKEWALGPAMIIGEPLPQKRPHPRPRPRRGGASLEAPGRDGARRVRGEGDRAETDGRALQQPGRGPGRRGAASERRRLRRRRPGPASPTLSLAGAADGRERGRGAWRGWPRPMAKGHSGSGCHALGDTSRRRRRPARAMAPEGRSRPILIGSS